MKDQKELAAYIQNSLNQTANNLLANNAVPVLTIGLSQDNQIICNLSNDKYNKDFIEALLSQALAALKNESKIIRPFKLSTK